MKNGGLTVEGVGALLREHDGNMAAVARHYGVTRQAVSQFCASRETLKAIFAECREAMKDTAESSLHRKVREGESWAVCFYLKCQAKDRGYVERTETKDVNDADLDRAIQRELARLAEARQAAEGGAPRAGAPPAGPGAPDG